MAIYANENGSVKNLTGEFATLDSGINIVELDIPHLDITPAAFRSKVLGWSGWGGNQTCYFSEIIKTIDLGCTPEVILANWSRDTYYDDSGTSSYLLYMGINASTASSIPCIISGRTMLNTLEVVKQGEYFGTHASGTPSMTTLPIKLNSSPIVKGSGQSTTTINAFNGYGLPIFFQLSGSQIIVRQAFQLNGKATASEASSTISVDDTHSTKYTFEYTLPNIIN